MKKPIYMTLTFLVLQATTYAQERSSTQRIGSPDVVAPMPAETASDFRHAMKEMEALSSSDIAKLLLQLQPPGKGDNAKLEYATNSYSYHVMQPGNTSKRADFVNGVLLALDKITDKDNKSYLIQLLQNAGDNTAVPALSTYLKDEYLAEKAARALARIGTEQAGEALLAALERATDATATHLVNALGFMAYAPAENQILARAGADDPAMRRTVFFALSRIGGEVSRTVLADAAASAAYAYEPTQATSAYLNYAQGLLEKGNTALAAKIASDVFKGARRAGQVHSQGAALTLLTAIDEDRELRNLAKAAKDERRRYRNQALALLAPHLDEKTAASLVKRLSNESEAVQVDILRFMANSGYPSILPQISEALHSRSPEVQIAAITALGRLSEETAVPELLELLPTVNGPVRQAVLGVLLTSHDERLADLVVAELGEGRQPEVEVLLLEVLARRGAGAGMPIVIDRVNRSASADVEAAAYQALPHMARPEDLNTLLGLLESADDQQRTFVQQAIVSAVNRSSEKADQNARVLAAFDAADGIYKVAFFPVLSGTGGKNALDAVWGYTDSEDVELRSAAVTAVAEWIDVDALPRLITLSRTLTDSAQLDAVIEGLVRLIGMAEVPAEQKVLMLRDAFEVAQTAAQKTLILRALEANKTYNAMLFAGRFLDDDELKSTAANTVMNIALDNKQFYGVDVTRLLNKVTGILSGSEVSYLRAAIRKHLAELPEGPGFVSLLQDDHLSGWKGLVADPIKRSAMDPEALAAAQQKADEEMREGWYVEDGVLHFTGHGNNIVTEKKYGDVELFVDWKLAKEGKDGDAGVYLRGTPQVQIWDTSRVNVGAQVGSGGLYNNQTHESKPLTVADNPLGEWNTFHITMVGDRVTVYLNGVLVTDDVVLENFWDRSQPIFPVEQIELQAHGTKVSYRDIYIREIPGKG